MKHRIEETGEQLSVEFEQLQGHDEKLLAALRECQEGRCKCPSGEYRKLQSIQLETGPDRVAVRFFAKSGEKIDPAHIETCVRATIARVTRKP